MTISINKIFVENIFRGVMLLVLAVLFWVGDTTVTNQNRIIALEQNVVNLDSSFTSLDHRVTILDHKVTAVDSKVTALDSKVNELDRKFTEMDREFIGFRHTLELLLHLVTGGAIDTGNGEEIRVTRNKGQDVEVYPNIQSLRDDPNFHSLVEEINLRENLKVQDLSIDDTGSAPVIGG